MNAIARRLPGNVHYAWVVVATVFATLLTAAGVRATPSVLLVPIEQALGWSAGTISFAISMNLLLYGLLGPFAAALMQRIGIRRTAIGALLIVDLAVGLSTFMTRPWQYTLTWGLLVGCGCGMLATVFGVTVVNRWFNARRGLALGLLTASSAAGQLIFLPMLAAIAQSSGWRPAASVVAIAVALVIPLVALLLPERPSDLGMRPLGASAADPPAAAAVGNPLVLAFTQLGQAVRRADFWLLFGSFFICGASANGLVGTHLISYCFDNGIAEVQAAGLLAGMGLFNIIGTTASGWLSDRYNPRVLLMFYYGLRGLSLLYLPYSNFSFSTLSVFAVFYGLDWIATVPPTMRLITDSFGRINGPIVYGWVFAGHQVGAGSIAFLAGVLRTDLGTYQVPFMLSGTMCLAASIFVLWIGGAERPGRLAPAAG